MRSYKSASISGLLLLLSSSPAPAQSSADWIDIKSAKELRAVYSNKTFRGKGPFGDPFVAHYRADGKGVLINSKQERIPRTWEVKGDQVCITDPKVTNCFTLQRHRKNRNDIVAQHVTGRWISQFMVEEGVPPF